jgi:uncharacterized ion transporter superfamily protein YfcC
MKNQIALLLFALIYLILGIATGDQYFGLIGMMFVACSITVSSLTEYNDK